MTWQKKQRARYETLVIAVANSFEPAPGAPASAAPVAAAPAPPQRLIAATALAFSGERFVAVLVQASCPSPRIGLWPARILRRDEKSGLTLIDADGAKGRRVQLPAGETPAGASAVVFFADGAAEKPVIVASAGEVGAQPPLRFIGALPVHANGAILVARNGAILGLAGSAPAAARKLASAANAIAIPPQSRELIPVSAVKDFAFSAGLEFLPAQANAAPRSAGALAVALEGSLFALTCAR
ncbi:MAG: hypothetical protein FJX29_06905 [Alphaproteobacteria bacterium]|nr:hypothetical protein [Alphaproteobacteria bacterium]